LDGAGLLDQSKFQHGLEAIIAQVRAETEALAEVRRGLRERQMTLLTSKPKDQAKQFAEPLFAQANVGEALRAQRWAEDRIKRYSSGDMYSETVTITPAAAEYLMEHHNTGNRSLRAKKVSQFVRIIKDGQWKLTSQGISFSREGILNNGQHRLMAIVASGHPCAMRVTWGEERDAFDVLDTGTVRGASDALHVAGFKNTVALAAAARLLSYIQGGTNELTNAEVIEFVERNAGLAECAGTGHGIAGKFRISSSAMVVALHLIQRDSHYKEKLPVFLDKLVGGANLPPLNPALVLRDGLKDKKFDRGIRSNIPRATSVCACIIKAWNAWVRGERMKSLRFIANEKFPVAE
jgi:hypothetical protein